MSKNEIIKLNFVDKQLIWGSEQWLVSAHKNGETTVKEGKFKDQKLSDVFKNNPDLFGYRSSEFPLLVKIIDAKDDLSIQVHPDDNYARTNENSLGKTECWYVLDANLDSDIVIGVTATSNEQLNQKIDQNKIEECLNIKRIQKGDFMYIPAGTVHAIRKNTKILEIQQSSDITYRLYDYNRKDANGNERELHLKKSKDVIDPNQIPQIIETNEINGQIIFENYFSVDIYQGEIKNQIKNNSDFVIGVLIEGSLIVNDQPIDQFEGFIVPSTVDLDIDLKGKLIITSPNN